MEGSMPQVIDRQKELRDVLEELGAIQTATHPMKLYAGKGRFDVYMLPGGKLFIVQVWQLREDDPDCWDIWIPACPSTKIDEPLDALKAWAVAGVEPK